MKKTAQAKAEEFLKVADQFALGGLPTEQRHPLTHHLADLSRHDIPSALAILKQIDVGVIHDVIAQEKHIARLEAAIGETLAAGHRVFFYGCGATGRLSMSIEYIWRHIHRGLAAADQVIGFMSGGDLALVHSIENFEDHPEFGARQVREIGFGPHDLLVSCSEGGETPSVIGATEEAARLSSRKPFFLYGNPDAVLRASVARSRLILDNPLIEKICLYVGPMSLSGSTRLQSSTALMLGAGTALLRHAKTDTPAPQMADFLAFVKAADFTFLAPFITEESRSYCDGDYSMYETDAYGITILTDTTERAPTFSLLGFENQNNPLRIPALSYLRLPRAETSIDAWRQILLRDPVTVEWDELKEVAGIARLTGFDFSAAALQQREAIVTPRTLHKFIIDREDDAMHFNLNGVTHTINVAGLHPLFEHLFLKLALNMHSTLVMGRMGRFESNVMTWVKPSNKKLIDRAIRYVQHLLQAKNISGFSYGEICHVLFEHAENMNPDDSIVMKTVETLTDRAEELAFLAPKQQRAAG